MPPRPNCSTSNRPSSIANGTRSCWRPAGAMPSWRDARPIACACKAWRARKRRNDWPSRWSRRRLADGKLGGAGLASAQARRRPGPGGRAGAQGSGAGGGGCRRLGRRRCFAAAIAPVRKPHHLHLARLRLRQRQRPADRRRAGQSAAHGKAGRQAEIRAGSKPTPTARAPMRPIWRSRSSAPTPFARSCSRRACPPRGSRPLARASPIPLTSNGTVEGRARNRRVEDDRRIANKNNGLQMSLPLRKTGSSVELAPRQAAVG